MRGWTRKLRTALLMMQLLFVGCLLDQAGRATVSVETLRFEVIPQFACHPEPVRVEWEIDAVDRFRHEPPCRFSIGSLCLSRAGYLGPAYTEKPAEVNAVLTSVPPELVGPGGIRIGGPRGDFVVTPEDGAQFRLDAWIGKLGWQTRQEESVRVVGPDDPPFLRREVFEFECSETGRTSWSRKDYARGQIATDRTPIRGVRNLSRFPVHLGVERERDAEGLPPDITEANLGTGRTWVTDFNGEYYGVWTAVPEPPIDLGESACGARPRVGTVELTPETAEMFLPPVEIVIEVEFGCADLLDP